jgi:hypothetical protein
VQRADEYANPKGDVLLTAQQGVLQWGLWVNTHKNPRFKLIDLGGLGMTVEIPKQIALASVALRVQVKFTCLGGWPVPVPAAAAAALEGWIVYNQSPKDQSLSVAF